MKHIIEENDIAVKYGLNLLGELIRIFKYNLDESV
jgi:hypothetical protein